ncbi:MAG: hypothetical protein AABW50_01575 [Nanoarchaeota archaeon]
MQKEVIKASLIVVLGAIIFSNFIYSGLGIKYSQESALVNEGGSACLTYEVYNPWSDDSNVIIGVSDELKGVLILQEAETKFVPAYTSSQNAIPVKFCFKVPRLYARDCLVGNFLCKLDCNEDMKIYEGDVAVRTVPGDDVGGGIGGSTTTAVVGAPLRIRVACAPHTRDYTLLYAFAAVISALIVASILFKKYRKPKEQRIKEKMQKLKEEMRKTKK